MEEAEEVLVALIEHRSKEVQHLRTRIVYYNSQLDEAEKALEDTQRKLARLRTTRAASVLLIPSLPDNATTITTRVKQEETSSSPSKNNKYPFHNNHVDEDEDDDDDDDCKFIKTKRKPLLVIPTAVKPLYLPIHKPKQEASQNHPPKRKKRKFVAVEDEKKDLIKMVSSCSSPDKINYESSTHIPSQHKRKLRTLVLCPTDDQLFATSALDGIVSLWQIQGKGSGASLVRSINSSSLKQRRWPEDVAWHPHGGSLISVYTVDDEDSQLAILNLNKGEEKNEMVFLEDKPHDKGIINNIMFMPWDDNCFVTCGSDHAVVYWTEKHKKKSLWKAEVLHRSLHSSSVMGVAGMQQKQMVVSVGADKRIIGFDLQSQKAVYKRQIETNFSLST